MRLGALTFRSLTAHVRTSAAEVGSPTHVGKWRAISVEDCPVSPRRVFEFKLTSGPYSGATFNCVHPRACDLLARGVRAKATALEGACQEIPGVELMSPRLLIPDAVELTAPETWIRWNQPPGMLYA